MAFYVPPPGLALDDLADRVARRVVDMYADIEAELIAQIARRVLRDLPANPTLADQLAVVRALQATAADLVGRVPPDLAAQIVQIAVEQGTAAAAATMGLTADLPHISGITRTAAESLSLIAQDLGSAFDQVHLRILRYPVDALGVFLTTDVFQQAQARYAPLRMLGTMSTDEVRKRMLTGFLQDGITGFTDIAGRRWKIGSYTEMAVRTTTARAFLDAGQARMLRAGTRFVTILGNNDACALCGRWFGKVLSIDGTPRGAYWVEHPYLDGELVEVTVDATIEEARAAGLHHPNCCCERAQYTPGLTKRVSAPHYDPVAEGGRERQRELERRIRDQKRRLGLAAATGDQAAVARAKAKIRATQAELRELTAETGQKRQYDREQARWADGPSGTPTQPPVVPTVAPEPGDTMRDTAANARFAVEEAPSG